AHVEEGHHPGPDAAGPRLAADGEGESHDQPEPDRQALIAEMLAAVEERAQKIRGERRQARFVARAKAIIGGDDYTVWRDGHGRAAPWPDRPRLLRLALARTEGEDDPDLRSALRYVVLQQLDPVEPPTAEELRGAAAPDRDASRQRPRPRRRLDGGRRPGGARAGAAGRPRPRVGAAEPRGGRGATQENRRGGGERSRLAGHCPRRPAGPRP